MYNTSPDMTALQQQQLAFTACIRDLHGTHSVAPVDQSRMDLYRQLFFNNFFDTLSRAFPILAEVLDEHHWLCLCQQFFSEHECSTPCLSHLPGEFVRFLQQLVPTSPPWMLELAQWEWSELELFLAPDPEPIASLNDDPLHGIPVLSPLLRLHVCRYPVHQISVDFVPDRADTQAHYLLAWRRRDHSIGFMQANELSAHMIEAMQNNRQQSGLQLLENIAAEQSQYQPELIIAGGIDLLSNFYNNNIILGSLAAPTQET